MKSAMRVTWETLLPMLRVRPVKIISTLVIFICRYLLLDNDLFCGMFVIMVII